MLRGLVLLLLLLACYVAPPLQGVVAGASEIRAGHLASEQVATLDEGGPKISSSLERLPAPPGPPPATLPSEAAASGLFAFFAVVEVVVQERPPSEIPASREAALRDQRPSIRRLEPPTHSLDASSSNA